MTRRRHPKKAVEAVIRYAESFGWRVQLGAGHAWAKLYCPHGRRGGCLLKVFSTPQNAEEHANRLRRQIDACPHRSDLVVAAPSAGEEE